MPALIAWLGVGGVAWAGEPVVHDGADGAAAVGLVAERAPFAADLEPVAWEDLRSGVPSVVEGGAVVQCSGPPLRIDVLDEARKRAESALLYGELDQAHEWLDKALEALPCVEGGVPRATGAGLLQLQGVVAFHRGDEALADKSFRDARGWDAALAWDERHPAKGARPAFEGAVAGEPVVLAIVAPGASEITVDGDPVPPQLASGRHLVAIDGRSLWIDVGASNAATVVVPEAFPEAMADAARGDLTELLAARFGEGARVFVVRGDNVWQASAGRTDWQGLGEVVPEPEPRPRRRNNKAGRWYITGAGVAAVGATLTGGSFVVGKSAERQRDALAGDDIDGALILRERYKRARTANWVGLGLTAAGAALVGVGIAVSRTSEVGVWLGPAGGGLRGRF